MDDLDTNPVAGLAQGPAIRLTEDVLRQHTLEEMRRNGVPSEDLSDPRPCSIRDSVFVRALEANRKANGEEAWPPTTSSMRELRQRRYESDMQRQKEFDEKMKELEKDYPGSAILARSPTPATTIYTGNWKREWEYEDLQRELREATKRDLTMHPYKNKPLSNSQDFLSDPGDVQKQLSWDDTENSNNSKTDNSEFLSNLPPHTVVDGFGELGVYMSQASYVVSLGGSALPDLKYGIIIVPAGDESLLFTGYGDHADIPAEFRAEIYAKSKEVRKQVFAEELEMCGSYVPRYRWRTLEFRLPPMEEPEKSFYAQRVRERRAKHRELHGTRRSSDPGSETLDEATSMSDQHSMPASRSPSSHIYIHADSTPLPPSPEVLDGLRRLFAEGQKEPGVQQGQELHHPNKLSELANFLWRLADGRVRGNPGLDEQIWRGINEMLPPASPTEPADDGPTGAEE
ncbi:hypothetical protein B0T21DRAFT_369092 [Apiosordaria backusii]|uniref:Uncharacterized protein n=1 Tax=Apiosordaria backusii TaxID=314023 RepID=A0AA40BDY0_9PEZI|nr:hypothetical protein B0T21DRAFT_369092 [Apiosordaria backusii]